MLGAITARDWTNDWVDLTDRLPSIVQPYVSDIRDIRNDIAATAVSSYKITNF